MSRQNPMTRPKTLRSGTATATLVVVLTAIVAIAPVVGTAGLAGATSQSDANRAPTADAGDDQTIHEYVTVTLDASGSADPDGSVSGYAWTQTGGPSVMLSNGSAARPTFTAPAVDGRNETALTFRVEVTDDDGKTDADTVTVSVVSIDPFAGFVSRTDVRVGEETTFIASRSDSSYPDSIVSYEWDFDGDGQTDTTGRTVMHAYSVAGDYEVELTVVDRDGDRSTERKSVSVTQEPPPVDFEITDLFVGDDSIAKGQEVIFIQATIENTGEQAGTRDVTLGLNGHEARGGEVTLAPGEYVMRTWGFETGHFLLGTHELTLATPTDMETVSITVEDPAANSPPTADAGDDLTADEGTEVSLDATGSADADGSVVEYEWRAVDGFFARFFDANTATPTGIPYTGPGGHTITYELTVTDDDGATDTDTVNVSVNDLGGSHTVRVEGTGSRSTYQFLVDGAVFENGGDAYDSISRSYVDENGDRYESLSGPYVDGAVRNWSDTYHVIGNVSALAVDGDATVYVDGDARPNGSARLARTVPAR